ncbi:MAG: GNAT family N-acetyltransferase [Chlamydiota bacterium]
MIEDISSLEEFNIRYMQTEDEPFLRKWLKSPGMLHWFSVETEEELEEMVKIWSGFAKFKCGLTATYQGVPCGFATLFLLPYIKLIHQSMAYIIVDPTMQRRHIGSALVRNLDHLAHTYFRLERMHYEIYGDNPLKNLLKTQGYKELFLQEHYIKEGHTYLSRTVLEKHFIKPAVV